MSAEIEVDGSELHAVLHRMATLGKKAVGPAAWTIGPDGLTLSWTGMADTVDGEGRGSAVALIRGDVMGRVARLISGGGTIRVAIAGDALRVGPTALTCQRRDTAPPQLLPLNARPVDVLRLHISQTPETLEDAGLQAAVDETRESLRQSCAAAGKALGWLDVRPEDIQAWILGRLAGAGRASPQIVVVDGTGQVALFGAEPREGS